MDLLGWEEAKGMWNGRNESNLDDLINDQRYLCKKLFLS